MKDIKSLIKGASVHQRRLEFKTYPLDDGRVVVEGWLRDDRLSAGFEWDGRPVDPGVIHWMVVRMLLSGWPLSIMDIEAEMPGVPHVLCPTTLDSLARLKGLTISSGYSQRVFGLIGGVEGCNHLTHLIIAMGPAALHGYWAYKACQPQPQPASLEEAPSLPLLLNSCRLWAADGPLVTEARRRLAAARP